MSRLLYSRGALMVLAFIHHAICKKWCSMTSVLRTIDCDCNEVMADLRFKRSATASHWRPEKQGRCALPWAPVPASQKQADHNTPMRRFVRTGNRNSHSMLLCPAAACGLAACSSCYIKLSRPATHSDRPTFAV